VEQSHPIIAFIGRLRSWGGPDARLVNELANHQGQKIYFGLPPQMGTRLI
jgi:hypothetical protein